jgi:hypothetical protein
MQTRTEYAAYVDNNDFVVIDGEVVGYVYSIDDHETDFIHFDVVDDEGEHTEYPFGPFDEVTIVESFEEDE